MSSTQPTLADRLRPFVPTLLLWAGLTLAALAFLRPYQLQRIAAHQEHLLAVWTGDYQASLRHHDELAAFIMRTLVSDERVAAAHAALLDAPPESRDEARARLLELCSRPYEIMARSGLRQLHFHSPDSVSLLRMHKPDRHGDSLADVRPTVVEANRALRPVFAFEEGRIFNGFRHVFPVFHDGRHIGSVETSFTSGSLARHLSSTYPGRHYEFLILGSVVAATVFEDLRDFYSLAPLSSAYLVERDEEPPPALPQATLAAARPVFAKLDEARAPAVAPILLGKRHSQLFYQPVANLSGQPVAALVAIAPDPALDFLLAAHLRTDAAVVAGALLLSILGGLLIHSRSGLARARGEGDLRLRKLARNIPGLLYQFRLNPATGESSFPYASEGVQAIYGLSLDELRRDGNPVFETIHPEDIQRLRDSIDLSIRELSPWHCEYRARPRGTADYT